MESIRKHAGAYFLAGLALAVGAVWYAVFTVEAQAEKGVLAVLGVGQGDAIFIQTEHNHQILIDGGPNNRILAKLGERMPFWDRSLDLIILTHPHADHVTGLVDVLKRYDVDMVMESGVNYSTPEYAEWRRLLEEKRIRVVIAQAGQRVRLSDRAYIDILAPLESFAGASSSNVHDAMVVAKLTYGSTTIMLTGDAERRVEYQLLASGANMDADILKVGHHGSKTSSTEAFLAAVSPEVAVISAGRKNRYGHPHQEVIDRLRAHGIRILRTDQDGDAQFAF